MYGNLGNNVWDFLYGKNSIQFLIFHQILPKNIYRKGTSLEVKSKNMKK